MVYDSRSTSLTPYNFVWLALCHRNSSVYVNQAKTGQSTLSQFLNNDLTPAMQKCPSFGDGNHQNGIHWFNKALKSSYSKWIIAVETRWRFNKRWENAYPWVHRRKVQRPGSWSVPGTGGIQQILSQSTQKSDNHNKWQDGAIKSNKSSSLNISLKVGLCKCYQ